MVWTATGDILFKPETAFDRQIQPGVKTFLVKQSFQQRNEVLIILYFATFNIKDVNCSFGLLLMCCLKSMSLIICCWISMWSYATTFFQVRQVSHCIASGIQPVQNLQVLKYLGDERKAEWGNHWIDKGFKSKFTFWSDFVGETGHYTYMQLNPLLVTTQNIKPRGSLTGGGCLREVRP